MPTIDLNGRRVEYTDYPLRDGPVPVIFLAESRDWWGPVAKLLPWDYGVRNFAWSGSVERMATDATMFGSAAKLPWMHLVGYGAGARAALRAAAERPETIRSIVAVAPLAGANAERDLPWDRLTGLTTPVLFLEPEGAGAEARAALDRLLEALPNSRPELLGGWSDEMNADLARRLANTIVTHIETAHDSISPRGVTREA
jgi:pimeloyl-ACP methyl ester carboxylesterase